MVTARSKRYRAMTEGFDRHARIPVEEAVKIDHPYYLTDETMRAYLARSGFDVLGIDYAADHLHVGYLCRLGKQEPDALPDATFVNAQWREIRAIQNPLP